MNRSTFLALVCMALGCASCGGSNNQSTATDTQAPAISMVSAEAPLDGQIKLIASASDAHGVTGYCFHKDSRAPLSNDSCFSELVAYSIVQPSVPTSYYVWAKDAAGNVSAAFERVVGPCGAEGVVASQASALPTVCVSTDFGQLVVELESGKAPVTVANFLKYVKDGFYADTVFHRVMKDFMVQAGGYTGVPIEGKAKTGTKYDPIKLEAPATTGLSNLTGTLAMARTSEANSATSEFFINVVDNLSLDTNGGGYAVFGRVISGMDTTIQAIRNVQVQNNVSNEMSQPLKPPVIQWAYRLK